MTREVIKYVLIAMTVLTVILAVYYFVTKKNK